MGSRKLGKKRLGGLFWRIFIRVDRMSCKECEKAEEEGRVYWYRWGIATIGIIACPKHAKEVIDYLNKRCDVKVLLKEIEKKDEEVSNALKEILDGKRKDTNVNRGALYGWGEALFWVKQKIRKAFEGVVE